jgi:bacteriocin biosynthesis cyclodehydratase domain-containing protein
MAGSNGKGPRNDIRFKNVYGVFALSPDEVQFRTGSTSGPVYVVSDPERRGLLGRIIERLLSPDGKGPRPWNAAEIELLDEVIPQLRQSGIIEDDGEHPVADVASAASAPGRALSEARIAIVGHGVLGQAIRSLLTGMACGPITMIESSSVAIPGPNASGRVALPAVEEASCGGMLSRPEDAAQWTRALGNHDWIVAAQDCFEPEEMTDLNKAALQLSVPWSMVCFDGYEGWVGPTFVPRQTACFECFRKRLFAGMPESQHVFMDPGVKVHRLPSPWSTGPGSGPWISLIASMFALELVAAIEGRSFAFNNMLVVHRLNLTFHRESVLRLPRCTECSPRAGAPRVNVFSHVLTTRGNMD